MLLLKSETRSELRMVHFHCVFACFSMVIKKPTKNKPLGLFSGGGGGGAYYRDDICVKNQGGLFSGGGGGGLLSGFYGIYIYIYI